MRLALRRWKEIWLQAWEKPAGRWSGALLFPALAFGLSLFVMPLVGTRAPFALFYPAVLVAGWFGGLAAGIVALAASTVLSVLLLEPFGRLALQAPGDRWSVLLFLIVAATMLAAGEAARRGRASAERERLRSQRLDEIGGALEHDAGESRATLEQALDAARMGYWSWEVPTDRVTWSRNLEEVHGLPPGSFRGSFESFLELIHADDRAMVQGAIEEALARGTEYHVEFRIPAPGGGIEWIAGHGRVEMRDGKAVRMTGLGMNISARKRAEADRRLLASIVDSSDDSIISKDVDGRILSWNRAAEQMYGYRAEEAIGQSVAMLLPPERANEFFSNMDQVRRGEKVVHHETLRRRKDGTVFEAALTVSPILDESGRIIGASKIARDISAWKAAQRERQRTRELFLGILGHDLRNPLNTIVASVFVLEKEAPESAKRVVARVARSAERMSRMIDQLLDFTRARLGDGIPLAPKPGDLRDICAATIEDLDTTFSGRVQFAADGSIPGLWDSDRVHQALSNLVVNGLKHGSPTDPVDVRLAAGNGEAVIEVTNRGEPIPDAERPEIFEPFRRSRSDSRDSSGLGLGLYIVREIVRAHGGTIEFNSAAGRTTFRMILPVVSEGPPNAV